VSIEETQTPASPWCDPAHYDDRDLARTIGNLSGFWAQLLSEDGRAVPVRPAPPAAAHTVVADAVSSLSQDSNGTYDEICDRLAAAQSDTRWRAVAERCLVDSFALWNAMAENARAALAGSLLPSSSSVVSRAGSVAALHVSDGGVPKRSVDAVEIGDRGVVGDRQAARQHHGRPWQALCLWSSETIAALAAEGHPIAAGYAGENITIAGLDWAQVIAGARLRIGDSVVADITITALPCSKNAQWFVGGNFNRMHHSVEPGVSRLYAAVIATGSVRVGDPVTLMPRGVR
jgi:MOSC domain-containing protein YiiM